MANKNIVLVLTSNQEYIKYVGDNEEKYIAERNIIFESMFNIYIPLISMCEKLEKDNIPFKFSLVLSPMACTLLDDKIIQEQYISWLDSHIELGIEEINRAAEDLKLLEAVKISLEKFKLSKELFLSYEKKLVKKIKEFYKKGNIELLATCGTNIFLPHYSDMEEILNAQVETGLYSHKYFFGGMPDGFWLPELGYASGFEKVIKSYGLNYTILDTRSFLFSEQDVKNGIFTPARFYNYLVAFGRDAEVDNLVFGEDGYSSNSVYKNLNRDIGFELPSEKLNNLVKEGSPRYSLNYKYWNKKTSSKKEETIYDTSLANEQVIKDAKDFLEKKDKQLSLAKDILQEEKDISLVCTIDLDKFNSSWLEGIDWIEQLFRNNNSDLAFNSCNQLISSPFSLQKIKPYYGTINGSGYGEDLLSNKNSWLIRYVRKASERMVDLANRFPSEVGLKARLLNLGCKELMLCQASTWAKMLNDQIFPEFAEKRFKESILDFTKVFDALGSNTVSTEWLTKLEVSHSLFPWMNYRIFSKKQ